MIEEKRANVPGDAFVFTGSWREYLPIAASNFLLTIVTLGIYRSWAKARERRYLWSRTVFIDDRLEWSGTGKEMFVGFLFAVMVAGVPLLAINMIAQGLLLRGQVAIAAIFILGFYLLLGLLFGFARFRALRYRLSRTWWHGVRGGSDDNGVAYAKSSIWKSIIGYLPLGFLVPWSMIELWNERWGAMSFGPNRFHAGGESLGLKRYWALILLSPLLIAIVVAGVGAMVGGIAVPLTMIASYLGFALVGCLFFAAYLRRAIGGLSLNGLEFTFDATGPEILLLVVGDIGLVVGTLGFGIMFLSYRHWSFLIRHLGAVGTVDPAEMTASTTQAPREAEGFADAFDVGAF